MITNIVLEKFVYDINKLTKADICIMDTNINIYTSTFDINDIKKDCIAKFIKSNKNKEYTKEYLLFKVKNRDLSPYLIIIKNNPNTYKLIGDICVSQLTSLILMDINNLTKDTFMQDILMKNISSEKIYDNAHSLNIITDTLRIVIIIDVYNNRENAIEMLNNIIGYNSQDFITTLNGKSIVIIKAIANDSTYNDIEKISNIFVDMFNTELMIKAKAFYGSFANDLSCIRKSFIDANLAKEICTTFYKEKNVFGYDILGIGRLIYKLPIGLCEQFIKDTFKDISLDDFDNEIIHIAFKFFENNLNISETSRNLYMHRNTLLYKLEKIQKITNLDIKKFDDALTFKLALMVINYMKYKDTIDI